MKRLIVSLASFAAVLSLAVAAALPASAAGGMANGRQVATHGTPVVMAVDGARLIKGPFGMLHTAGLTAKTCNGSTATWFHLTIWGVAGQGFTKMCYGGKGQADFPNNHFRWSCSGNNNGSFQYYPHGGGTLTRVTFGPGYNRDWSPPDPQMFQLNITGWTGSNTC